MKLPKFPMKLRHKGKGKVLAIIYKRPKAYRLYWRERVDGKGNKKYMGQFACTIPGGFQVPSPTGRMEGCSTFGQYNRMTR
jgi:hypothetical protein